MCGTLRVTWDILGTRSHTLFALNHLRITNSYKKHFEFTAYVQLLNQSVWGFAPLGARLSQSVWDFATQESQLSQSVHDFWFFKPKGTGPSAFKRKDAGLLAMVQDFGLPGAHGARCLEPFD